MIRIDRSKICLTKSLNMNQIINIPVFVIIKMTLVSAYSVSFTMLYIGWKMLAFGVSFLHLFKKCLSNAETFTNTCNSEYNYVGQKDCEC